MRVSWCRREKSRKSNWERAKVALPVLLHRCRKEKCSAKRFHTPAVRPALSSPRRAACSEVHPDKSASVRCFLQALNQEFGLRMRKAERIGPPQAWRPIETEA